MSPSPRAWPHVVAVLGEAEAFGPVFDAAARAGMRVGWLRWRPAEVPEVLPSALEQAATLGALRAVAVAAGRTLAVKPRRGEPILRDILREHFRGCALVLVEAANGDLRPELPSLLSQPDGFVVKTADGARLWTADSLVARLPKPRPW